MVSAPRRISVDEHRIKMLLYGVSGSGKTTLAATAADSDSLGPVLFLNFEAGLLSIAERGDIDAVDISSIADVDEVIEAVRSGVDGFSSYSTIVIDSGSELYQRSLDEAVNKTVGRDLRRGRSDRTIDTTTLEDYGTASRQTYRVFRALRDLPLNVIVTAHAKFNYAQGADTRSAEPTGVEPLFSGTLTAKLVGIFDFVHFLYENDGTRFLLTQSAGSYVAKTRGHSFAAALGQYVENPYLPAMFDLLRSSSTTGVRPELRDMHAVDHAAPDAAEAAQVKEDTKEDVVETLGQGLAESDQPVEVEDAPEPPVRVLRDRQGNPITKTSSSNRSKQQGES